MDKLGKKVRTIIDDDIIWQVANAVETPAGVILELVYEAGDTIKHLTIFDELVVEV